MKTLQTIWLLLLLAAILFYVPACGGGGGGGGEDKSIADEAYTGIRTQAYIDANNAEALVLGAYGAGDIGLIVPLATDEQGVEGFASPFILPSFFKKTTTLVRQDFGIKTLSLLSPTECLNYPLGTLSDTLEVSGDTLEGEIYFENCEWIEGVIFDGTMGLKGSYDEKPDSIIFSVSMTMNPLFVNEGIEPVVIYGRIVGKEKTDEFGIMTISDHYDFNFTAENQSGQTFWLNNYVIDDFYEFSGLRETASGRYYDYNYGYVDFTTVEDIFVPYNPTDPTYDGLLEYTGRDGTHANLWLGVNQDDYCINVFNASGWVVDIGTCAN